MGFRLFKDGADLWAVSDADVAKFFTSAGAWAPAEGSRKMAAWVLGDERALEVPASATEATLARFGAPTPSF